MKESRSQMLVTDVKDEQVRDNFNKLNLLWNGGFVFSSGRQGAVTITNLTIAAVTWAFNWSRIGDVVTLHFDPLSPVGTKAGTMPPALVLPLPQILWPRGNVNLPWPVASNGVPTIGLIAIGTDGSVSWTPYGGWTASATAAIYPATATYLGS